MNAITPKAAASVPSPDPTEGLTAADAAILQATAQRKRAEADASSDPLAAATLRAEAYGLDSLAAQLLTPAAPGMPELRRGRGGEALPAPDKRMSLYLRQAAETVHAPPDTLHAEASHERLMLAREAGVLGLAVDAAESAGAQGAVQSMLAHQIAAGHRLAMRLMTAAANEIDAHERARLTGGSRQGIVDAARSAAAAARLMDSVGRASLTVDRLRHGARQQVTVQHVTVADGGQAVVAGSFDQHRTGGGSS